jgi:hypothetical protein
MKSESSKVVFGSTDQHAARVECVGMRLSRADVEDGREFFIQILM